MDVNLLAKLVEKRPTWFAPCAGRSSCAGVRIVLQQSGGGHEPVVVRSLAPALVCLALGPPAGGSDKKKDAANKPKVGEEAAATQVESGEKMPARKPS